MPFLDPAVVKSQLTNLLVSFPELADDEILRADMIEGETDLHQLLTKLVEAREDAEAMEGAIKSRISDLAIRKARMVRRQEAAEELIFKMMQVAQQRKIQLPIATLSIGDARKKVIVTDEDAVPAAYCKIERTPKKTEIKAAIEGGEEVPGCLLSNGGDQLSIRVK